MELYTVGKIVNTHGIRGEVKVVATTDFVDQRFADGATLYLVKKDQAPVELTVNTPEYTRGWCWLSLSSSITSTKSNTSVTPS